jgi:hypothetical protein
MKYMILDISNLLYRTYYANKNEDELTIAGLAQHQALLTLNKFYREQNPDKIVMAFDRKAWRIEYTTSELCISGKKYKGHRRKDMTEKERTKYENFLEHLRQFEELMKLHTSVICLAADGLEADDLVAGFVQKYAAPENEIIAISTDKDYIQILKHENVKLIDPASGKERTLEEWGGDADLFMFEKCIRGDSGDNVQSAYPRVRKTRIMKAWEDPLERVNMMEETWVNQEGKTMLVKEVFKENEMLMDLSKQPQEWRDLMNKVIEENMENPGKFSLGKFMMFLGKFEMKKVADNVTTFAEMLSR